MTAEGSPIVRGMFAWEIQEARRVFANSLNYQQVRIHEMASWPNAFDRAGRWLKRMPPPTQSNAITLGYHLFFPVRLVDTLVSPANPEHYKISWLMHELTHSWQYQKMGWSYLIKAVTAQQKFRSQVYDFGGETGLRESFIAGKRLKDFNLEQQGDICRTFYDRWVAGLDLSAWMPYIHEIQNG